MHWNVIVPSQLTALHAWLLDQFLCVHLFIAIALGVPNLLLKIP